ncbi:hypothetical protein CaCOL14_009988 [Colletotrichum acutatum]
MASTTIPQTLYAREHVSQSNQADSAPTAGTDSSGDTTASSSAERSMR